MKVGPIPDCTLGILTLGTNIVLQLAGSSASWRASELSGLKECSIGIQSTTSLAALQGHTKGILDVVVRQVWTVSSESLKP